MDTTEQRFRALLTDAFDHLPSPPTPASIEARGMRPARRPSRRHRFVAIGALTAGAIAVVFVVVAAVTGNDNTSTKLDTSGTVGSTSIPSGKVLRTLTVDGETWQLVEDDPCLAVLDPGGAKHADACGILSDFRISSGGREYKGVRYSSTFGRVPSSVIRVELEMRWGQILVAIPSNFLYFAVTTDQSVVAPGGLSESPPVAVVRFYTAQGLLCGTTTQGPQAAGLPSCTLRVTTTT